MPPASSQQSFAAADAVLRDLHSILSKPSPTGPTRCSAACFAAALAVANEPQMRSHLQNHGAISSVLRYCDVPRPLPLLLRFANAT